MFVANGWNTGMGGGRCFSCHTRYNCVGALLYWKSSTWKQRKTYNAQNKGTFSIGNHTIPVQFGINKHE